MLGSYRCARIVETSQFHIRQVKDLDSFFVKNSELEREPWQG